LLEEVLSRTTQTAQTVHFAGFDLEGRPLGRGAAGLVIAARDPATKRRVALKILDRRMSLTCEAFARDNVLREAKMMAGVIHQNVVTVHRIGFDEGQAWIAMELVKGVTLRSWQREDRSWSEVLATYVAAGRGLAAAHHQGIIHGDFKPDNVLIDARGTPKLADFGLATLDDGLHSLGGTPQYMAPEQHADRPVRNARSEQFTFCVALFEALTGTHPYVPQSFGEFATTVRDSSGEVTPQALRSLYRRELLNSIHNKPLRWPRLPIKIPRRVKAGLVRGLDPEPARRFPSMDALLDALDLPRASNRRRTLAGAAMLGLVAGGVGAAAYIHDGRVAECRAPGARFDEVWSPAAQAALEHEHPDVAAEVKLVVERFKERWSGAYAWNCERTARLGDWEHWRPVQSCLEDQLTSLQIFVGELSRRDTDEVRTISHGLSTRSPDSCALWDTWDERGEKLRRRLNHAMLLGWAHDFDGALAHAEAVVKSTERRSNSALLAEAYKVRGALRVERSIRVHKDHLGPAAPGMADLRRAEIAALAADAPAVAIDAWLVRARALAVMHDTSPRTPLPLNFLRRIADKDGRISRLLKDQEANLIELRGLELYNDGLRGVPDAYEEARRTLEDALDRFEGHGDSYSAARVRENLAKVLLNLKNFKEAIRQLDAAQSHWRKVGLTQAHRTGLIAESINAMMTDEPAATQRLVDSVLDEQTYTKDERLVLMLPSIYAYWGEPRAFEIALQAMALVEDASVEVTSLHEVQLRIAALGAFGMDRRAQAHLAELERWADEVSRVWRSAPTDHQRALALGYIGGARLIEKKFTEARDRLEACRVHIGWQAQNPETKAEVLLDLAESHIALDHHYDARDALGGAAELIPKADDVREREAFEVRLRDLRRALERR